MATTSAWEASTPPSTPGGGIASQPKQTMTPMSTHRTSSIGRATASTSRVPFDRGLANNSSTSANDNNYGRSGADLPLPPRHDDQWILTHLHTRRRSKPAFSAVRIAETVFASGGAMDKWYFTHAKDGRLARKNSYNTVSAMLCDRLVVKARDRVLATDNDIVCVVRRRNDASEIAAGESEVRTELLRVPEFLELLSGERLPWDLVSMQEYIAADRGEFPTLYINTLTREEGGPARKEITSTRKVVHMSASKGEDVEVEMRSVAREMNARFDAATRAIIDHLEAVARVRVHSAQFKYAVPGSSPDQVVFIGAFDFVATRPAETVPFHLRQARKNRGQLADSMGRRVDPNADQRRERNVLLPLAKDAPKAPLAALLSRQRRSVLAHRQCHGDYCDLDLARCAFREDGSIRAMRRVAKLPDLGGGGSTTAMSGILRRSVILARQDHAVQRMIRMRLRERSRMRSGAGGQHQGPDIDAERAAAQREIKELERVARADIASERPELYYERVSVCEVCAEVYRRMDEGRLDTEARRKRIMEEVDEEHRVSFSSATAHHHQAQNEKIQQRHQSKGHETISPEVSISPPPKNTSSSSSDHRSKPSPGNDDTSLDDSNDSGTLQLTVEESQPKPLVAHRGSLENRSTHMMGAAGRALVRSGRAVSSSQLMEVPAPTPTPAVRGATSSWSAGHHQHSGGSGFFTGNSPFERDRSSKELMAALGPTGVVEAASSADQAGRVSIEGLDAILDDLARRQKNLEFKEPVPQELTRPTGSATRQRKSDVGNVPGKGRRKEPPRAAKPRPKTAIGAPSPRVNESTDEPRRRRPATTNPSIPTPTAAAAALDVDRLVAEALSDSTGSFSELSSIASTSRNGDDSDSETDIDDGSSALSSSLHEESDGIVSDMTEDEVGGALGSGGRPGVSQPSPGTMRNEKRRQQVDSWARERGTRAVVGQPAAPWDEDPLETATGANFDARHAAAVRAALGVTAGLAVGSPDRARLERAIADLTIEAYQDPRHDHRIGGSGDAGDRSPEPTGSDPDRDSNSSNNRSTGKSGLGNHGGKAKMPAMLRDRTRRARSELPPEPKGRNSNNNNNINNNNNNNNNNSMRRRRSLQSNPLAQPVGLYTGGKRATAAVAGATPSLSIASAAASGGSAGDAGNSARRQRPASSSAAYGSAHRHPQPQQQPAGVSSSLSQNQKRNDRNTQSLNHKREPRRRGESASTRRRRETNGAIDKGEPRFKLPPGTLGAPIPSAGCVRPGTSTFFAAGCKRLLPYAVIGPADGDEDPNTPLVVAVPEFYDSLHRITDTLGPAISAAGARLACVHCPGMAGTGTGTGADSGDGVNGDNNDNGDQDDDEGGDDTVALATIDFLRHLAAEGHLTGTTPIILVAFGTSTPGALDAAATVIGLAKSMRVAGVVAVNGYAGSAAPGSTRAVLDDIRDACVQLDDRVRTSPGSIGERAGSIATAAPLHPMLTRAFGRYLCASDDTVTRLITTRCAGGTAQGAARLLARRTKSAGWLPLTSIDCVVALVRSEGDPLVPAQGTAGIVRALGSAEGTERRWVRSIPAAWRRPARSAVVTVPGVGHDLIAEAPDFLASALVDMVRGATLGQ